jgi:competence ComEA-like helix-hairpin-helix protein
MKRRAVMVAAAICVVSVCAAAIVRADQGAKPAPAPAPAAAQDFPIGNEEELAKVGEAMTEKACNTQCHGLEKLDEMRRFPREWNDVLTDMITRGVKATDKEVAIVKQYLKRYYGVVAINTATVQEISAVLGFSAKDAQAIVDYRTANGKFADAAALAKVPGIDKAKLDEQPDAIRY